MIGMMSPRCGRGRRATCVSGASALAEVVLRAGSRDGDAPMRTVVAGPDLMRVTQRVG